MRRPGRIIAAAALVVACGVILWVRVRTPEAPPAGDAARPDAGSAATAALSAPAVQASARVDAGRQPLPKPSSARVTARWGSGPNELGRSRPEEGNPEAPMSLAVGPDGALVVLDQVNGRLVRFGADGSTRATELAQRAPQDLAIAADGTTAVLDRLGDRNVALYGPDGRALGQLPLSGAGLPETGGVTGLYVDGDQVYAEREHGQLVHLGDTRGAPSTARDELQGRPTRDGKYTLLAGIIEHKPGRIFLAENARPSGANRFTRELDLSRPVLSLLLLDSDKQGQLYLAALLGDDGAPPEVELLCHDEETGAVRGDVPLPANTGAEETLRDLVALDSGGVLYALRDEDGVSYRFVPCP